MSHIFDALVRSKHERTGSGEAGGSVTDILENAEQQAAAQREAEVPSNTVGANESRSTRSVSIAGGGAAEGQHHLENAIQDRDAQKAASVFPVAAVAIPDDSRLVSVTDPNSPAAEAFRLLGVRLRHLRRERRLHKLLITSTVPQEGKSMIAANLACTMGSASARPVLLLEGDMRRPTLARMFGVTPKLGISDYLQDKCDLTNCIYRLGELGFWLLPAGDATNGPLELLQSSRLQELMQAVERVFDWIIIDSPPFLPLADSSIWERWVDGVMLVARQGTTGKRKLEKGLEAIDQSKMLCALINSSTNSTADDYYYHRGEPAVMLK